MPGPDYDPRGRANRALLVGVYRYQHADDLPGVRHNLGEMFDALLSGGVFGTAEIQTESPQGASAFLTALDRAVNGASGLLLVYFAGHGRLSRDGSELFLTFEKSERLPGDDLTYSESVSWNAVLGKLRSAAHRKAVDQIVVILDCCYAGNALESFKPGAVQPGRERISVLTAVQVNRSIPAGDGTVPTPYTEALVHLLRTGTAAPAAMGGRAVAEPAARTAAESDADTAADTAAGAGAHPGAGTGTGTGRGADARTSAGTAPGPDPDPAAAGSLVRLTALAEALQRALRGRLTSEDDPWEPRHYLAEGGHDVILGVAGARRPQRQSGAARILAALGAALRKPGPGAYGRRPGPARPGRRPYPPGRDRQSRRQRFRRTVTVVSVAVAVLVGAGGYGIARWAGGGRACPVPVQLRLLTDPDEQPTMSRAVDAFLASRANHDGHGCRLAGIGLDAPKEDDAVTGFRQSAQWRSPRSTGSFQPQRDIGAQPDIWIPGSSVSYQRARAAAAGQAATMQSLGPVAYSPLVLAVLRTFAVAPVNTTGVPLADLVAQMQQNNKDAVLLRADPEYTDSAQLATVGLYGTNEGQTPAAAQAVRGFEQQAAKLTPAPRSSYELMCTLAAQAQLEDRAAVLVPEQVMAQFNNASGPHAETGCDTGTLGQRVPEYPADVAMLDLPFVHVRWQGGGRDATARDRAVRVFHDWLTGPEGQRVFTDAGYRGLSGRAGRPAAPAADSWLIGPGRAVADPQAIGYDVSAPAVDRALAQYRTARGSGQVLYLLDSSTSMGGTGFRVWSGPGGAKDLVAQTLDELGPGDEYGVWTVSGRDPAERSLVPFGRHADPAAARRALDGAGTGGEAHPPDALRDALASLASHASAGHPQLLVFVTDDEDDTWLTDADVAALVKQARKQQVAIDWVSLVSGGCTGSGHRGPQVAPTTGGRCLDSSDNQAAGLRDEVARVGTGDAR